MSTYPNEAWPADAAIEVLDGTLDPRTGLPFVPKGTGPGSEPSYEVQYNRRQARLNSILAGWRQGMVVDEGNLRIGVYPIEFTRGGQRRSYSGATGVAVADNVAKVVYLDAASILQVEDEWPGDVTTYLPLATVTASGGRLTIVDRRTLAAFHVPSVEAAHVRDRWVLSAHRAAVGEGESGVEVFRLVVPGSAVLTEVQVYCTGATAAGVDVKRDGVTLLSEPAIPVAGEVVWADLTDGVLAAGVSLTVHVTTGEAGGLSDLAVTMLVKSVLAP